MARPLTIVPVLASLLLVACATHESPFVGEWRYDRQSLRELAHAAALESITDAQGSPITGEERDELRALVDRDHDGWDKRLLLRADGSFLATSQIGGASLEVHSGMWTHQEGSIRLVDADGETFAIARLEGRNLVLEKTDDKGTTGRMVMLPGEEQGP